MRRRPNDREAILDAAIRDGKIEASRRAEYARWYDANPAAIRNLLTASVEQGGLMHGLVRNDPGAVAASESEYDLNWLTAAERQRLAEIRSGAPVAQAPVARAAPTRAAVSAAPAPPGEADEYDPSWLSGEERERIAAAKEGRLTAGPVHFEDGEARRAANAAAAR
jgi:hypothetical protein